MTINEKMKSVVDAMPEISDFYYADPVNVIANEKVGATPLFRLLRSSDGFGSNNIGEAYNQNETLMFTKVMDRTPLGDDEENAENELIKSALTFLAKFSKLAKITVNPVVRWGRRSATTYSLGLIIEFTIDKTFLNVGECVTGYYLPDKLNDQQC